MGDLLKLIEATVDVTKADYAFVTGVQVHSSSANNGTVSNLLPTLEFVAPQSVFAVVGGKRVELFPELRPGAGSAFESTLMFLVCLVLLALLMLCVFSFLHYFLEACVQWWSAGD